MGDFLFGFIIGRVAIGLFKLYFKLLWFLARTAWWLVVFLLASLGAGIAWLARGGHGPELFDSGGFGEYLANDTLWQDLDSGTVYPVSADEREYCEVYAEYAGMHWRRTALSRMLRQGAITRYRFVALTDQAADGTKQRAGWLEFLHEARKNIGLDELNPAYAGAPELMGTGQRATENNRNEATDGLEALKALLVARGWAPVKPGDPVDELPSPSNQHWYAHRFCRRVIAWDSPVATDAPAAVLSAPFTPPAEAPAVTSAEQSGGQL